MNNIAESMFNTAERIPDKTAVIFNDKKIPFSEVISMIKKTAAVFKDIRIAQGDKVGLSVGNCPEFYYCYYAALSLGAVIVPLNVNYTIAELNKILINADVKFLVNARDLSQEEFTGIKTSCPELRGVISLSSSSHSDYKVMELIQNAEENRDFRPVEVKPEDTAVMLYTSATTGVAKGVMITHANISYNYRIAADTLEITEDSVIFGSLPMYNTFGLNLVNNVMAIKGATVVLMERFKHTVAMEAIEKYRITFMPAVPTMVAKIMYADEVSNFDLSSISVIYVGGALVPESYREKAKKAFPNADLVIGYGLSEATAVVSIEQVRGEKRSGSVGKILPGVQVKIAGEDGNAVADGAIGEICVKSAGVMKGYHKMEQVTTETIRDGWLFTGDMGYCDRDGYLYFIERKKDMIIRGGQNIYPAEIENVISAHPKIAEVAVVAVQDEIMGEEVKAFVSLKGRETLKTEELIDYCAGQLARFKIPKYIEILEELPKGPTGKILRRALREMDKSKP